MVIFLFIIIIVIIFILLLSVKNEKVTIIRKREGESSTAHKTNWSGKEAPSMNKEGPKRATPLKTRLTS